MNAFKYIGVYSRVDEKFTVFSFPTDNDECDKCIQALPNTINNATKYTGVFEIDRGSRIVPKEKQEFDKNVIKCWNHLIQFDQNFQFNADVADNFLFVYKMNDMLPKVVFSISINQTFKIVCYITSQI